VLEVRVFGFIEEKGSKVHNFLRIVPKLSFDLSIFAQHLVDSFGKPSQVDREIVESDEDIPGKFALVPRGYAFFIRVCASRRI
jgi:hypothetical protein